MGEERSFRQVGAMLEQLYWNRGGFVKRDARVEGRVDHERHERARKRRKDARHLAVVGDNDHQGEANRGEIKKRNMLYF